MKTSIYLLLALGAAFTLSNVSAGDSASCCAAKSESALSPRAQSNQTIVVAGQSHENMARTDLGSGARAKAFAGSATTLGSSSSKAPDLARGGNDLGVAARTKSTANADAGRLQIAPLK